MLAEYNILWKLALSFLIIAGGLYLIYYLFNYSIIFTLCKVSLAVTIVLVVIRLIIYIFEIFDEFT